jgi:hypothetical protein
VDENTMSILLVLEDPFGSDEIMVLFWPWHQFPHFVALKVVEFFMHGF